MTHDTWQDSVGAYVLGALPGDERVGFEAHLAGCAECRAEVEHLRVAAEALSASPEQVAPPPELKERIMSVVRAEAELLQAAGARADMPEPPRRRERRAWWSFRPAMALAATAVLAVGVVTGALLSGGDGRPGTRTVVAQVELPGAAAHLELRDERVELVARGLPDAGRDRVYQVWLQRPGQPPQPTDALFTAGRDGSAAVRVPGSLEGVEAVLVTREPDGGSAVPSEAPVISAPVA